MVKFYDLVKQKPRDPELAILESDTNKIKKSSFVNYGTFMIKTALAISIIGNVVLMTTLVTNATNATANLGNVTNATANLGNVTNVITNLVNLSDFPFELRCHLESTSGYVKDHIFAHICYNEWLHSSIVDLRIERDGNVTIEELRQKLHLDFLWVNFPGLNFSMF